MHPTTMKVKPDKTFLKRAKKLLKKNPNLKKAYEELYIKLASDPFDPSLHTHALTGQLKGKHGCSLTYELRVIFKLYDDTVHLLDMGTHDEVY
jgi:addiction module RelE/StbE family toxin